MIIRTQLFQMNSSGAEHAGDLAKAFGFGVSLAINGSIQSKPEILLR